MGIDCSGTLYVTSQNRLYLINPTGTGTVLGSITVNAQSATNVAFGGANHQTLYVSGHGNGTGGGATMGLCARRHAAAGHAVLDCGREHNRIKGESISGR